ncbi:MAG: MltA domain-containing protein [Alphaproteobacteria bacterium]|nr:MltA domain-containing protein [Alphaproteobacteria bacterium]
MMIFGKFNLVSLAELVAIIFLSGCDVTPTTHSGDKSIIPSNMRAVSYSALPDWDADDVRYALQAFRNTCRARVQFTGRVIPDRELLIEKCNMLPSASADNATVRAWFESNFQPYQVIDDMGQKRGTYTGYYSPEIPACRQQTAQCNEPLMGIPTDGRNYKNVDKKTIVNNKIGRVLYWANIVDVQNIQIQGSGLLKLDDGTHVKLNFAATNDMPFKSIGEQLRNRGIKPSGGYSANAVWTHLKQNPTLAREVIYSNPRYVYFKEAESKDVVGKLGTPLSKIRSIAVDDSIYTVGLPVYVNTNLSDGRKFRRLMIAQDTGSAIRGWIRADIFFGSGDEAYKFAHGQHSTGEMYILMPKEYSYVKPK